MAFWSDPRACQGVSFPGMYVTYSGEIVFVLFSSFYRIESGGGCVIQNLVSCKCLATKGNVANYGSDHSGLNKASPKKG